MRVVLSLGRSTLVGNGKRLAIRASELRALAEEHELIIVTDGSAALSFRLDCDRAAPAAELPYSLDAIAAQAQGLVGYRLGRLLDCGIASKPAVAVVSRVLVDPNDAAFAAPATFVGPGYDEDQAVRLASRHDWIMALDGIWWRRVVAAPEPLAVLEVSAIADLIDAGNTVVCAGAGCVPVAIDDDGAVYGVEATVDSDRAAAQLAIDLRADELAIITSVDGIYDGYGSLGARLVREATIDELAHMEFPARTMAPKVQAACTFVSGRAGQAYAAIGSLADLRQVVSGEAGTVVLAGAPDVFERARPVVAAQEDPR
jgi:carbamate kinase